MIGTLNIHPKDLIVWLYDVIKIVPENKDSKGYSKYNPILIFWDFPITTTVALYEEQCIEQNETYIP